MTNTNNKKTMKKKLISAIAMLTVSAVTLSTATYAWFTMNKEVSVTGMQVKAHAEEGLLINEVAAANSNTWDELATGGGDYTAVLRPASTSDLVTWWHANSKIFSDEAGLDNLSGTVNVDDNGNKYVSVSESATGVYDKVVVGAVGGSGTVATDGTRAETHVFYKDASFGDNGSGTYQDGEGFYVRYTYYLKSSGDEDLTVSNLQVRVKATKNTTGANASGSSDDLDPCLRVGVTMNKAVDDDTVAGTLIFAPITGGETTYDVTTAADGSASEEVTAISATTGSFSAYTTLNKDESTAITIPKVTSDGIPVQVYVWFEGEDEACKSINLTDILAAYDIDVGFMDADIY